MLTEFKPPPGIVHDGTDYSARGYWHDCNWIRFRGGFPERMGGWLRLTSTPFVGVCRHLEQWTDLSQIKHIGVGTSLKYYLESSTGVLADITPIRKTTNPLPNDPISTTNGSHTVTITDTGHGAFVNDYVTFSGATAVAGLTVVGEYQIVSIVDADHYTITHASAANATTTGGGAVVVAAYQINTGSADYSSGTGWGSGGWGVAGWGRSPVTIAAADRIRLWSADNFGEDLVFNPRGGGIYYYDTSAGPGRAVALSAVSGASDTPTIGNFVMVGEDAQRVFVFGANPVGSGTQDPLLIRWSNDGDPANFTASDTTTAGELRIPTGNALWTAVKTRGRKLIWTESSMYSMQFVEGLVYGLQLLSSSIDIISPNCVANVDEMVMWMGRENFMLYDGTVRTMPCPVREYVFSDINIGQAWKIYANTNRTFREVWWFYPSATSSEIDRYVVYNYAENVWYYGMLERTAWDDTGILDTPIAASTDGYIYYQETGLDDGSTTPASAISTFVRSAPVQLGDGQQFTFVNRIVPDIAFHKSATLYPSVNYSLTPKNYPGADDGSADGSGGDVTQITPHPVETWTEKIDTRLRGRQFTLEISSEDAGVFWRAGVQRFDVRPDGRR